MRTAQRPQVLSLGDRPQENEHRKHTFAPHLDVDVADAGIQHGAGKIITAEMAAIVFPVKRNDKPAKKSIDPLDDVTAHANRVAHRHSDHIAHGSYSGTSGRQPDGSETSG
jgi:hypothetical protein